MKIGIVGGGGIGSYYAALLAGTGHDVVLLTRGAHLDAVRSTGLTLRRAWATTVARPEATDDGSRLRGSDVVIVSVKGYSLPEVAPAIASAASTGSTVVPLLNGVDVAERLEALGVPRSHIAGGLARVSVVRTEPGIVEHRSAIDEVTIGAFEHDDEGGERKTTADRLGGLVAALSKTGVVASVSDDIRRDLWRKFAFIVPMTVACGLSRTSMGPVTSRERGRWLLRGALAEVGAVSRVSGAGLGQGVEEALYRDLIAVTAHVKPSFLLDLERGGPTELDMLAGTVSRIGRERGVATPIHDVAVAAFEAATGS